MRGLHLVGRVDGGMVENYRTRAEHRAWIKMGLRVAGCLTTIFGVLTLIHSL